MRNLIDELEIEARHADNMAAMVQFWMTRAQEAERALAVVVHAAGGKVVVHHDHLCDIPNIELVRMRCDHDMTHHFRTRLKTD